MRPAVWLAAAAVIASCGSPAPVREAATTPTTTTTRVATTTAITTTTVAPFTVEVDAEVGDFVWFFSGDTPHEDDVLAGAT